MPRTDTSEMDCIDKSPPFSLYRGTSVDVHFQPEDLTGTRLVIVCKLRMERCTWRSSRVVPGVIRLGGYVPQGMPTKAS